ncbi:MAG: FAD-binding oxidoreductase [Chitinivibrionales bacterium]|nr:FAD-binding oxidoreductase [Chitinivibrionales bacterium]
MGNTSFDVIILGGGSVGVPTALFLTLENQRVLVIEKESAVGQGQQKAAIGGVRATHSDPAKILLCKESLSIFSSWEAQYGHDIGWKKGGYTFPVYREKEETTLKGLLPTQKSFGLNINWIEPDGIKEIIPGVNPVDLRGGTFSPDDGQVSPLLAIDAMFTLSKQKGCTYKFRENVTEVLTENGRVTGIKTDKDTYYAPIVVNATGSDARQIGQLSGLTVPVTPDSHEAGISAPMEQFLGPLVVDLRPGVEGKTSNFYFGQNHEGAIIFCYTPSSLFVGTNRESTSEFLPILASRMIQLIPRLKNILIRRVWRGLYPMTPDGLPIIDKVREIEGLYLIVGMCGQGFMLGPGVGKNMAHFILHGKPLISPEVFNLLSFYRDFYKTRKEALK